MNVSIKKILHPSLTAWLSGVVFGLGLLVSGMSNPAKVLGFLDLGGLWDPSLALVMVGAIAVGTLGFAAVRGRDTTCVGAPIGLPTARKIDRRLVGGSVLFGMGWGVAGFCPGPGLVGLGTGDVKAALFVLGMLGGMLMFEWLERLVRQRRNS